MSVSISSSGGSDPSITGAAPASLSSPYGSASSTAVTTYAFTTTGTYTLTFTGVGGGLTRNCTSQLIVNTNTDTGPSVNLTATPSSVVNGQSTVLSWTSANATSCTASATPSHAQWSGALGLSGSQSVTMTQNTNFVITCSGSGSPSPASDNENVVVTGPVNYTLTLTKNPPAGGTVTSSPAGITCNTTCGTTAASFASGTSVQLTAAPASGYSFSAWSGGCVDTKLTCTLTMNAAKSVTATFVADNQTGALLTITSITPNPADTTTTVTGTIRAAGKPSGFQCASITKYLAQNASPVNWSVDVVNGTYTLTQTNAGLDGALAGCPTIYIPRQYSFTFPINTTTLPNGSYTLQVNATGYSGAFSGTGNFTVSHPAALTVTKAGTGSGTVTSSPAGIDCGATCNYSFVGDTVVTLSASASPGSTFAGWSGSGCSGTGTCVVTMSVARSVTATFNTVACPAGTVGLSPTAINVTQTSTASAPVGFSGGTFVSGTPGVATVSSSTLTGVSGGTSSITGTGWSHTSGAINCSLSAATLTVRSFTISASATPSSIPAGTASTITVTIGSVQGGTMPVVVTLSNSGSLPTGWSVSPITRTINAGSANTFTLSTTTAASQVTFGLNFSGTYNGYSRNQSVNVTVLPPIPNPPQAVDTTNTIACGQIRVMWNPPTGGGQSGYRVYRSTNGVIWSQVGTDLGAAVNTFDDTSPLNLSGPNYYAVAAFNASGESAKSEPAIKPITPTACSVNFTGSDKDIVAVNGSAIAGSSVCSGNDETTGLPDTFKSGDRLRFKVSICNTSGTQATTNLTITDTMSNLSNAGNFIFAGDPGAGAGYCTRTSQSIGVNTFTFGLQNLAIGANCSFTFEATITPASAGASIFDFQNILEIYNNSILSYTFRTDRYASIRAPLNPEKKETF
jgi:hypothetical protein